MVATNQLDMSTNQLKQLIDQTLIAQHPFLENPDLFCFASLPQLSRTPGARALFLHSNMRKEHGREGGNRIDPKTHLAVVPLVPSGVIRTVRTTFACTI